MMRKESRNDAGESSAIDATPQRFPRSNFARQLPRHSPARGIFARGLLDVENVLRPLPLKQRQFEQVGARNDGVTRLTLIRNR